MLAARRMLGERLREQFAWGIRSNTATLVRWSSVALLDPAVALTDISAHIDPGSGQCCLVFGCSATYFDQNQDVDYLFLAIGGSGPGLFHFTRVSGVDTDTSIQSIGSLTGVADYGVTVSGSVVTVTRNSVTQATITLTGSDSSALSRSVLGLRGTFGASNAVTNFSADAAAVTDAFTRTDSDGLGYADTGQLWLTTS